MQRAFIGAADGPLDRSAEGSLAGDQPASAREQDQPAARTRPRVKTRPIEEADIEAVIALGLRAIEEKWFTRQFWVRIFSVLKAREAPADYPRYGYLLESEGRVVGFLLLIYSLRPDGANVRCNGSTLYVEPDYRVYAPALIAIPHRDKKVTVLNVTPARHIWPMIEAVGFKRYNFGVFIGVPLLASALREPVRVVHGARTPQGADPFEADLVRQHLSFGCLALWCETRDGAWPFVFRPRRVQGFVPCAHVVYCRSLDSFARFARPIGGFLARRGYGLSSIDADGALDMPGLFRKERDPHYFKGPEPPRQGDLAFTETAMFGI